jgi:hypothetical protein
MISRWQDGNKMGDVNFNHFNFIHMTPMTDDKSDMDVQLSLQWFKNDYKSFDMNIENFTPTPHLPTYHLSTHSPTHPLTYLLPIYLSTNTPIYLHTTHLPTHQPTHLLTYYPFTYPPTYLLIIHLPTYLFSYPPTYLLTIHLPTYLFTYPPTYLLTIDLLTYLFTYPLTSLPTYLPTHLPHYLLTYLPTYLPTLPCTQPPTYPFLAYHPTSCYLHHSLVMMWNKHVKLKKLTKIEHLLIL